MKIGLLTGGGDSPAINAAIRAVVRKANHLGYEVIGFRNGWKGVLENNIVTLKPSSVSGILPVGGTIIGTSRTNPLKEAGGLEKIKQGLQRNNIDAVIAIGGDDTLGVTHRLAQDGIKAVGVPQTIDNDIDETDYAIGFDTAVNIVMECLDRLHSTAASHSRVIVCEIMGRDSGWLALLGGMSGGADVIIIPEVQFDLDLVAKKIMQRHNDGKNFSLVAVAEGAKPIEMEGQVIKDVEKDAFGHVRLGGIGEFIAVELEERTGLEVRAITLGHLQRGGSPTAFDRILATKFGIKAVEMVRDGEFDRMVRVRGQKIGSVELEKALKRIRPVDKELYELTELFR